MSEQSEKPTLDSQWDPVYLHARKEAAFILGLWFLALLWTLPFSYFNGFESQVTIDDVEFVFGMPKWVFWGIGAPWMACNLVTIWFCFFYFSADDLDAHAEASEQQTTGEEQS